MRKFLLILFCLCSAMTGMPQQHVVQSAAQDMSKGYLKKAKEQIDRACLHDETKNQAITWYYAGLIYCQLGHESQNSKSQYSNLGQRWIAQGWMDKAIEAVKKCKQLDEAGEYKEGCKMIEAYVDGHRKAETKSKVSQESNTSGQEYVDLGLPRGTLWKSSNESGYYGRSDALKKFKGNLPTNEQFVELKKNCTWKWDGKGYMVVGPNGSSIRLIAMGMVSTAGYLVERGETGYYLSCTAEPNFYGYFQYLETVLNLYNKSVKHKPDESQLYYSL